MAVYVDDMHKHPMGRYRRMKMCHMIADSEEELHAMADHVGVARRWYQGDHYDIAMSKRSLAVEAGAVEVTMVELASMCRRQKVEGHCGAPEEARQWWLDHRQRQREAKAAHERNASTIAVIDVGPTHRSMVDLYRQQGVDAAAIKLSSTDGVVINPFDVPLKRS